MIFHFTSSSEFTFNSQPLENSGLQKHCWVVLCVRVKVRKQNEPLPGISQERKMRKRDPQKPLSTFLGRLVGSGGVLGSLAWLGDSAAERTLSRGYFTIRLRKRKDAETKFGQSAANE